MEGVNIKPTLHDIKIYTLIYIYTNEFEFSLFS